MKKKRNIWKKILIGVGIFFGVLILLALILPFFFKAKVKEIVKSEINKQIIAKANFTDVDISLLRSFPKLNTRVLNLEVNGVGDFEGKNLLKVKELSLDIDILSVLLTSRPVEIINFSLQEPFINILINPDGKANYNIFKETDETGKSSESKLINLKKYSIENGQIVYTDHQNSNRITLKDINHTGKGNFKTRNFVLKTNTDINKMSYFSAGVPLAKDLHLTSDLAVEVDLDKMQFKLSENSLKINDLSLVSEGVVKVNDKDIELDLKVKAPGNNFRELFSIVPNAYISDFKDVKTEGSFSFAGFIKGKYGLETDEIPDFDFNIKANDGYVKYPKLELPVEKINADIRIYKTGDMISNTNVNIMPLTFSVSGESFLIKMLVSDLTTDPLTNGEIRGTLNLDSLAKAFPMKDFKRLTGKIYSDIVFNVNQSLSKKNIKGKARLDKVFVSYSDMPAISVYSLNADFNNDIINCTGISAKAGKSDFSGTLKVLNPLNYNAKDKTVTIDVDSKSNFVDADEWTRTGEETEKTDNTGMLDLLINKLKLKFRLGIQDIKFEDYDIKRILTSGFYENNILKLDNTDMIFSGSNLSISGILSNIISWSLNDETLSGKIKVESPHFDLDKFMTPSQGKQAAASSEEPFELPDKMDIAISTNIGKVNYTGKELNNLSGKMHLKDQRISFNQLSANGLGGELNMSGEFAAEAKKKPVYDLKFSLGKMRYEEVYRQVISFQSLAPIAKFLNGFFNADFSFKGSLNEDMSPQLETINAAGLIQTINGHIKSFTATNEIAEKLNIQTIKEVKLDDVKGSFEIINGILKVKPFDVKFDDMNFNISGINKLDKTIDYVVHAKIPRAKLDKIPAGQSVNKGIGFLTSLAKEKGLNIDLGETIKVDILISGPVLKPKLKFEYKGNEGKEVKNAVENKVNSVVDETKSKVNEEVEKKKREAENKAKEVIDSTKKKVENKAKETVGDLKKKAQKELENKLDSTTKKKANDVLNQYNPFKKKK